MPKIIVSHALPHDWVPSIYSDFEVVMGPAGTPGLAAELRPHLADAVGLLSMLILPVGSELLAQMPALRVVSNMAVGVNNIDLAACTARGVPVGHTPGLLTDATADLTLALLLSLARRLPEAAADARAGRWQTWLPDAWLGLELRGATLGIVGMGRIGQAVARRARSFGMNVLYHSRRPVAAAAKFEGTYCSMADLLAQSDVVALHVPLTDETHHLIDAAALRQMKRSALLVNVARGPVVDTSALLTGLREGWIAGAALDVTDPEPLPADHPLYALPNCLISPHIGSATDVTRRGMAALAAENLLAGLAGRRLPHVANPAVYGDT